MSLRRREERPVAAGARRLNDVLAVGISAGVAVGSPAVKPDEPDELGLDGLDSTAGLALEADELSLSDGESLGEPVVGGDGLELYDDGETGMPFLSTWTANKIQERIDSARSSKSEETRNRVDKLVLIHAVWEKSEIALNEFVKQRNNKAPGRRNPFKSKQNYTKFDKDYQDVLTAMGHVAAPTDTAQP